MTWMSDFLVERFRGSVMKDLASSVKTPNLPSNETSSITSEDTRSTDVCPLDTGMNRNDGMADTIMKASSVQEVRNLVC